MHLFLLLMSHSFSYKYTHRVSCFQGNSIQKRLRDIFKYDSVEKERSEERGFKLSIYVDENNKRIVIVFFFFVLFFFLSDLYQGRVSLITYTL